MKRTELVIALALGAFAATQAHADVCRSEAAPWITLEIGADRIKQGEAAEYVDIDKVGCVTTRYAALYSNAGVYQRQLGAAEHGALAALIARTRIERFDADALKARLKAEDAAKTKAAAGELTHLVVADGDRYRIRIDGEKGAHLIEWYAPLQEAGWRKHTTELQQLVEFILAVRAIGDAPDKTRVAEVEP